MIYAYSGCDCSCGGIDCLSELGMRLDKLLQERKLLLLYFRFILLCRYLISIGRAFNTTLRMDSRLNGFLLLLENFGIGPLRRLDLCLQLRRLVRERTPLERISLRREIPLVRLRILRRLLLLRLLLGILLLLYLLRLCLRLV